MNSIVSCQMLFTGLVGCYIFDVFSVFISMDHLATTGKERTFIESNDNWKKFKNIFVASTTVQGEEETRKKYSEKNLVNMSKADTKVFVLYTMKSEFFHFFFLFFCLCIYFPFFFFGTPNKTEKIQIDSKEFLLHFSLK